MVVPYCLAPTPIDNLDEHLAMLETAEAGSMPGSLPESRKRFVWFLCYATTLLQEFTLQDAAGPFRI